MNDEDYVDFRERIAVMPRLLDDADLAEFRRLGIRVGEIRRERRRYLRELLGDVERESLRVSSLMAQAPNPNLADILEFRKATRRAVLRLRVLSYVHAFGIRVAGMSRKQSAAITAILLGAER